MLKKTITYKDFNGTERTEDFFFHLSKADLTEMELGHYKDGGYQEAMQKIIDAEDGATLTKEFKKIILGAYGEKSSDGRRFIRSAQLSEEFSQTEAYVVLFMELATDADKAAEFIKAVLPDDLSNAVPQDRQPSARERFEQAQQRTLQDAASGHDKAVVNELQTAQNDSDRAEFEAWKQSQARAAESRESSIERPPHESQA